MKTPAGMGKQSKLYVNQRVKKKTSRIKNQLKKNDSLNDQLKENDSLNNNKSNCHTTSPSTNDTFLIHPYINPLSKNEEKKRKRIQQKKTFGDHLVEKETNQVRIVSQNVNCIGVSHYHNHKIEDAKNWLLQHDVDIAGWQETGVASIPSQEGKDYQKE